jgi:cysteine-rich repeat protein
MRVSTVVCLASAIAVSALVSHSGVAIGSVCGNGTLEAPEQCDDGNTAAADGCSAACTIEGPLDTAEQACVNGVNAGFAGMVAFTNKAIGACLRDVASGRFAGTFEQCLASIEFGGPLAKVVRTNQKKCVAKGVTEQTAFAYNDDAVDVATQGALVSADSHRGMLGTPATVAMPPGAAAKCQQAVAAGVSGYLNALAKESNKRKKASLREPSLTSIELAADLVGAPTAPVVGKALAAAKAKAGKKCEGQALAALFPGQCEEAAGTSGTLLDCAAQLASCELCLGLNAADRLAVDCAQYSPWPACDPAGPEDCGDGTEQFPEECDDGNTATGDGCRSDCTDEICGDATTDPQEECDDGNTVEDDGCATDCTLEGCGDGDTDDDEVCDDGNTADGDGCRADCTEEICGDNVLDPQEECDEGDTINGDGCDSNCQDEFVCSGATVGNACWFLAPAGGTCDDACTAAGLEYDTRTATLAGSGGSGATCQTVLTSLAFVTGGSAADATCATGAGCYGAPTVPPVLLGTGHRCTSPATDAASAPPGVTDRRACACEPAED